MPILQLRPTRSAYASEGYMNDKIRQILAQITELETELKKTVDEQQLRYRIEDRRIVFEQAIKEAHLKAKMGLLHWFLTVKPQNYLTAPVIYGMIVPMVFLDMCLSIYQFTCFPIYKIARVQRKHYIVMDHQHLAYLNLIEKADCMYCSYAVGLLAYAGEITARTEQYFCPIKHAQKVLSAHARYKHFLEYGDAGDFHARLDEFRQALAREASDSTTGPSNKTP